MKKLVAIFLSVVFVLSLTGCKIFQKARTDAENFANSTKASVIETKENIEALSDKVGETIDDVKTATQKLEEAKNAVDAITK